MKMQSFNFKNQNGNEPFSKVFLSTLAKVGNLFIICFAAVFFLIKKGVLAVFKKKSKQTLKQYIENLDKHLNAGRSATKPTSYAKVKAVKPNYTVSSKKSVVQSGFSQPKKEPVKNNLVSADEQEQEKKKASGKDYTPINPRSPESAKKFKKKSPIKKHLPKVVAVLSAAIVIVSAIFVINSFAGKEKGSKNTEPTQVKQVALENLEESTSPQNSQETSQINSASSGKYNITEPDNVSQTKADATPTASPEQTASESESAEATPIPLDMESDVTAEIPTIPQDLLLHVNDTNEIVPFVQEYLMDLHYMDADEPTDFYGQQTEYAIQLFQRGHGLMVDGVAGYETLKLLFSDKAMPYLVRKGDYGFDIYIIKKRLIELGYLNDKNKDKNFDDDTDYAVRVFQGRNKLSQDGIIGHNTIQVMLYGDAKPAKNYNPPSSDDGGSVSTGGGSSNVSYDANSASDFVAFAKAQMNKGYTYVWGGKGPPGMDCSGFVYYCLNSTGNKTGYMTSASWAKSSYTTISSIHDAKPGDILCFDGHVAICIGGGKMIDSSSSSNAIRIANYETSNYWNKKWICAKRRFS